MSTQSRKNRTALMRYAGLLAWGIVISFCTSCSGGAEKAQNGNQVPTTASGAPTPPSSPSPSPSIEPLKTPETVASGTVTESRGAWSSMVQQIMYVSSADNTRQPMMFYKPNLKEPRPLLVALHSWSEGYKQTESVIYSECAIANDWIFVHQQFRGPNVKPDASSSDLVIGDVLSAIVYDISNAWLDVCSIDSIVWCGCVYVFLLFT